MFKPYRRPTVAVVGAGVAGCAAASECAFSGFDTVLFEQEPHIGGHFNSALATEVSRKYHFRTPYLRLTRTDGSPASVIRHLEKAVEASGSEFRGSTEVTGAEFDRAEGQWEISYLSDSGQETQAFDVLIRATGEASPWISVPGRSKANVDDMYLHHGVEVFGLPNALFVDGPTPRDSYLKRRPLAVIEARADHCRRYVRQLEIRGPGELTVKHDKWLVQPGTVRGIREVLAGFDAPAHDFKRASNYASESASSERQTQQKSATALKEA